MKVVQLESKMAGAWLVNDLVSSLKAWICNIRPRYDQ